MESYTDDLAEVSVFDGTNVANNTYFNMGLMGTLVGKFRHISFTGRLIDGAGETTTLTIEATNDEDLNNANWVQVYGYDARVYAWVNQQTITNGTLDYAWDFDYWNYKFIRARIQTTAATNTVIIKARGRT